MNSRVSDSTFVHILLTYQRMFVCFSR